MNNKIDVMEKPDTVSWDEIHNVLWAAHETTRQAGIYYPTSEMSGKELEEFIKSRNGRCFVALDGEKVVGTMSCYVEKMHTRFLNGNYLTLALIGNVPEYKGKNIFSLLYNACHDYAKSMELDGMIYGTAEKNHTMQNIFEKKGFILYRCNYNKSKKRFVVGGIYCFNKLPYGKIFYNVIFRFQQILMHIRYAAQK